MYLCIHRYIHVYTHLIHVYVVGYFPSEHAREAQEQPPVRSRAGGWNMAKDALKKL